MSTSIHNRIGSISILANAILLIAAGAVTAIDSNGGLSNSIAPILYYAALLTAVFSAAGFVNRLGSQAGRTSTFGYLAATAGAVLYSAPAYVLVAGTSGITSWHDVWGYAMGNVLLIGAPLYFIGWIFLGIASLRSGILPRWSGWLIIAGYALWLVVFFIPVPGVLPAANLIAGIGTGWVGAAMLTVERVMEAELQHA